MTANGYVVARTRAAVSAKIPGRLASLRWTAARWCRRARSSPGSRTPTTRRPSRSSRANLASAEAELIEAEADRDQAAARVRPGEGHPRIEPEPDLRAGRRGGAEPCRPGRGAGQRGAGAGARRRKAALQFAEANLENTFIRAPFTGTVLRKEAEVGEVVAPSVGGGLTRGAVVTMADLSTLEVEVDVNEAYIARVQHGQPARITLDAYPDTSFRGRVRQVVPTADRQRATVQVKVSDPRPRPADPARDGRAGGLLCDVGRHGGVGRRCRARRAPRFRLPAAAVRESGGGDDRVAGPRRAARVARAWRRGR